MAVSHAETGRPTRCPDPVPPSQPVTTTVPPDPAAAPVEAGAGDQPDAVSWCHCCRRFKPKADRAGWRCGDCARRAAKVPPSMTARVKLPLYDSEGNLIKANAK